MYVRKPYAVDAVSASAGPDAVRALVGGLTVKTTTGIVFVHDGIEIDVPAGAWVVKDAGDILVVSAEAFAERYEALAPDVEPEPESEPAPVAVVVPEPAPVAVAVPESAPEPTPKVVVSVATPASTKAKGGKK